MMMEFPLSVRWLYTFLVILNMKECFFLEYHARACACLSGRAGFNRFWYIS
jgi:hypothetical protein